jgi:hypothetical protein
MPSKPHTPPMVEASPPVLAGAFHVHHIRPMLAGPSTAFAFTVRSASDAMLYIYHSLA